MAKRRMRDPYQLRAQADRISKEIIDIERSAREVKTAKLRAQREALQQASARIKPDRVGGGDVE